MTKRQTFPDIFRFFLMFGICVLHCITHGDNSLVGGPITTGLQRMLHSCVNGFVLITGFFGTQFRPSKVIKLYACSFFCGVLSLSLGFVLFSQSWVPEGASLKGWLSWIEHHFFGQWFLNAYVWLLFVTPLVNAAVDVLPREKLKAVLYPVFLLCFGWCFLRSIPLIRYVIPTSPGIGSYTGTTLLGTYTVGRCIRKFWDSRGETVCEILPWRKLVMGLVACWVLSAIGFTSYASPVSVCIAVGCFCLASRIQWSSSMGQWASFIAPTLFPVLLLHDTKAGYAAIQQLERYWIGTQGLPTLLGLLSSAVVLFVACICLDLPRRLLVRLLRPFWQPLLKGLDDRWKKLVTHPKSA